MTSESDRPVSPPEDGDLLRFLDEQMEPESQREMAAFVRNHPDTAARLQVLRRDSARVRDALSAVDPSPPAHAAALFRSRLRARRARRWRSLRLILTAAAAVIALMLIAPGVRAFIVQQWTDLTQRDANAAQTAPTTSSDESTTSTVTIAANVDRLIVTVRQRQAGGSLHLALADDTRASARIEGGSATDVILVSSDGFRIQNSPESTARYQIRVPKGISEVVVEVGEDFRRPFTASTIASGVEVFLGSQVDRETGRQD